MSTKASAPLPTFEVDKAGLAKLLARKGKEFAIVELVQNAWDEDTTTVHITLERIDAEQDRPAGRWKLVVEDDNPEGFADLRHAYTLFAESAKKADETKRGRFNLGEKLVVAVCESAIIETTKGTIAFTAQGRHMLNKKRAKGSVFTGIMELTDVEVQMVERAVYALIPPAGVTTTFNMGTVPTRTARTEFDATLRTEKADADGNLRPTSRKTKVVLYEPLGDEPGMLYELGIPVVETGDRWHVDVQQKVPLNTDRDNVPPSYLKTLRALVLNAAHDMLKPEETTDGWVSQAIEDKAITPEAITTVVHGRFGDKAVISDPTDREANHKATSQGYTVVAGGAMSKAAWGNVRASGALLPAGQVTPGDKAEHVAATENIMNPDHYPTPVAAMVAFAKDLGERLLTEAVGKAVTVEVRVYNEPQGSALATYTIANDGPRGTLSLNYGRLGYRWFEKGIRADAIDLLIHEFGHHFTGGDSHLDSRYYHGLTKLAGAAVMLALAEPAFFEAREVAVA